MVAVLTRRFGDLDIAEEATPEVFTIAVERWRADGVPPNPSNYIGAQDTLQGNPGRHGRGQPDGNILYYTDDEDLQTRNHDNKCRGFTVTPGNQCDEYPPASTTREDDYDTLGNWQGVRGVTYQTYDISAVANNGMGQVLRNGYGNNRIVNGDGFYIEITP